MDGRAALYLEDVHEGQTFTGAARHGMTAEAIKGFAAEFDPQPFHLDEATAQPTFFNGLAASGWHTAAATMRLIVDALPLAGGVIGGGGEIAWPRPTRPGDLLRVVCTVEAVAPSRSRPERGVLTLRTETLNQRDEPVQVMVTRLVVPRRDTAGLP
jgi:acyl dehydratase